MERREMKGRKGRRRVAALVVATTFTLLLPAATHATPAPATDTAAWTGVSELVVANLDASGAVSGSPSQTTVVAAASTSTVQVGVPMSSGGLHAIGRGLLPPVVDNVAQFTLEGSGTQTQAVSADFVQALPVTLSANYQLDGKPTTPAALKRSLSNPRKRSGTVAVSYEIANVTSQTTTVSFVDAAGRRRTETVTQAIPMAGSLTLTFPKDASHIDAPGAALTPGAAGVGASWDLLLAPPLAPARQSISYSMTVTKAAIPRARLTAAVIVPSRPVTGDAPAAVGAAVATQQATAQAQVVAAQSKADAALEKVQADLAALGQARSNGQTRVENASDAVATGLAHLSDRDLSNLSDTISTAAAQARAEIEAAAARIRDALEAVRPRIADHLDELTAHAGKLALLAAATTALKAKTAALATEMAQHVADTADLKTLIAGSVTSLDLLPDHSAPEWVQLAGNLAAAQAKADVVAGAATDIESKVAQIDATAQQLNSDVVALTNRVRDLIAAVRGIRDQMQVVIEAAQNELEAALQATVDQVTGLRSQADAVRSDLAGHDRAGAALAGTVRQQASSEVASKAQAAAASAQSSLAGAQSKAAQASASYAQLLALAQLGLANQLPAGNATGATVQSGAYVFRIPGTH